MNQAQTSSLSKALNYSTNMLEKANALSVLYSNVPVAAVLVSFSSMNWIHCVQSEEVMEVVEAA